MYHPVREEDTPKERGEDAVIRYLQGCRDGDRRGGGGQRYVKMVVLRGVCRNIVRMRRQSDKSYRFSMPENFRRCPCF